LDSLFSVFASEAQPPYTDFLPRKAFPGHPLDRKTSQVPADETFSEESGYYVG
jgi:hypothetical protein